MQKDNESKIVMLNPKNIYPHPKNPRKDLGDLTELRASVKKNGIMQNLTVIPTDEQGKYMALIGHRRSEAARLEELEEVPCIIKEGLSELEQLNIMMEENMQRNDLTIYEQAQGFQLMLDLGETAESIAEKSGFSLSTVYHRLNIAKLNQKELQKKQKDDSFQLSITDLYELEKVQSIKTRNKILKDATNSRNMISMARNAARDEQRESVAKDVVKILKKIEVQPAPPKTNWYDRGWEKVKEFDLDKKAPKNIKLQGKGPFYYLQSYGTMYILKKAEKKKSETDLLWEKREKNKKGMKAIVKNMDKRRRQFVLDIISGAIEPVKNEGEIKDVLWKFFISYGADIYKSSFLHFYYEKESYKCTSDEEKEATTWLNSLTVVQQMLIVLCYKTNNQEPYDYFSRFDETKIERLLKGQEILEKYGWFNTEEEQQLLDGTHELYEKKETEK